MSDIRKDDRTDDRQDDQMRNEGEGSRTADREYREGVRRHVASGTSERAAAEAEQALEGAEGDELRQAEAEGKAKARRKAS
jgi:hypothetical protein